MFGVDRSILYTVILNRSVLYTTHSTVDVGDEMHEGGTSHQSQHSTIPPGMVINTVFWSVVICHNFEVWPQARLVVCAIWSCVAA